MTEPNTAQPVYDPEMPLVKLFVSDSNARRRDRRADIDQLARNIDQIGLQQPIVVKPNGDNFEILIGQRRFEAHRLLGRTTIAAKIIYDDLSDLDILAMSFSENVQRRDLEADDKADVCVYLAEQLGSAHAAAQYLGVSDPTIRYWIDYAGVPEPIKELVVSGKLKKGVATRIWQASKDNQEDAEKIAQLVAERNPPLQERNRLLAAFEEDPSRTPEETVARAQDFQFPIVLRVEFPASIARGLRLAASEADKDMEDIVLEAASEWLESHQYSIER